MNGRNVAFPLVNISELLLSPLLLMDLPFGLAGKADC